MLWKLHISPKLHWVLNVLVIYVHVLGNSFENVWCFYTWVTIPSHDSDMYTASEYHIMILKFYWLLYQSIDNTWPCLGCIFPLHCNANIWLIIHETIVFHQRICRMLQFIRCVKHTQHSIHESILYDMYMRTLVLEAGILTGMSNCTPQFSAWCYYLSVSEIPASGSKFLIHPSTHPYPLLVWFSYPWFL